MFIFETKYDCSNIACVSSQLFSVFAMIKITGYTTDEI